MPAPSELLGLFSEYAAHEQAAHAATLAGERVDGWAVCFFGTTSVARAGEGGCLSVAF